MWLVNAKTFRLRYFAEEEIPKYAILSHRWEEEEVSFANMLSCQMVDDVLSRSLEEEERLFPTMAEIRRYRVNKLQSMKGWDKLRRFCGKSRAFGYEWAWLDTVCIDKSSSSELQEAINSMFTWYQNAGKCFVYMFDVTCDPVKSGDYRDEFRRSSWFKRGWTLQELLAPTFGSILFFNHSWEIIGSDEDFINDIVSVTGIPEDVLTAELQSTRGSRIKHCSLAQRFSWAASRQVTRGEDAAYSLLGIFNVNMPLLYGEGRFKAFERLQLEVLKISRDESILSWNIGSTNEFHKKYGRGIVSYLLARSPQEFTGCEEFQKRVYYTDKSKVRYKPYQMIPTGLLMEAIVIDRESPIVPSALQRRKDWTTRYALPLFVSKGIQKRGSTSVDTVIMQLTHWNGNEYFRPEPNVIVELDWDKLQKHHKLQQIVVCSNAYFESLE